MKKRIVNLVVLLLSLVSINLYAQTLTSTAPNGTFTSEDIDYWVGEGSNEIAIILAYNSGFAEDNFVLGYRWNGNNITLEDALIQIAAFDSRFDMDATGGFLDDFGFDYDEDGVFEYSAFMNGYGYLCLKDACTDLSVGMSGYYLVGNHWISIELKQMDMSDWFDCFVQNGTYTAISDPAGVQEPCPTATNFRVDWIEETSAYAFWESNNPNFIFYLKQQGEENFTAYPVSGSLFFSMSEMLQEGTTYECYLVTDCGNNSLSEPTETITFTTLGNPPVNACDITSLPYTEDFESYGVTGGGVYPYPTCWTKITTGNIPNINTTKHSGVGGLYLQAAPSTQVVAVMPKIADNINMNTLSLTFWGKRGSAGNRITVGVMTNQDDASTFDTLFAVSPDNNAWAEYTLDLSQYTGNAKYIAFMCNGSRYYIDDVVLSGNTTPQPTNPSMTDENIIAWAKGVEVVRANTVTAGNYYDAIGQANTTNYVAILDGYAKASFDRPITNHEGADFVIFAHNDSENGRAFVEVSSNGTDFFRFTEKTTVQNLGYGTAYDLDNLADNENLDKNNIRLVRLVDDNMGVFNLAGIGVYHGGEQYLIADFEEGTFLTSANTYEIVAMDNYTRTEEDEDTEMTYYYKDHVSAGLNFPGIGYDLSGWFMTAGFGASNGTSSAISGNGGEYVDANYYVSSAMAGVEGVGYTYMQSYDAGAFGPQQQNEIKTTNNTTFFPQGVYVSHSNASYTYTGSTNDYEPGYHKIIATGYDAQGTSLGSVYVYLTENGHAYKDWKWLDLSSLGEVAKVKFTLESNYANSYGLLIPSYFCVDNFVYTAGNEIEEPCSPTSSTLDITLCEGNSYTFDEEHSYTEAGTYEIVLTNVAGCDSTITLNIAVMPTYNEEITLEITSDELPYQVGEQLLTEFGTYTLNLTSVDGCDSVVTLTLELSSGINEVENFMSVSLYPNPTSENAMLNVKGLNTEATIIITDQQGRIISTSKLDLGQENSEINTNNLPSGVYYVRIQTENAVRTEKLIKK